MLGTAQGNMAGAIAFMVAAGESYNVMSALNSSPWSAENFTADSEMARSCMEYIKWTAVANTAMGLGGSVISHSWWPLIATTLVTLFMFWLYSRAIQRGLTKNAPEPDYAHPY